MAPRASVFIHPTTHDKTNRNWRSDASRSGSSERRAVKLGQDASFRARRPEGNKPALGQCRMGIERPPDALERLGRPLFSPFDALCVPFF
jgi:hypothetical protein